MILSILVCTTPKRVLHFLPRCIIELERQCSAYDNVQYIYLGDNKKWSVGRKRNELISICDSQYVVFVDDDDMIEPDYVSSILSAITTGADCIVFDVMRYENGVKDKVAVYDINFKRDDNPPGRYERLPNHLMCFRRDIAIKVPYLDISFGEDAHWARTVRGQIRTQHKIDKILYNYYFNKSTTETQ